MGCLSWEVMQLFEHKSFTSVARAISLFVSQYIPRDDVLTKDHIDGLVQERCNSSALAMELYPFCTNPLTWSWCMFYFNNYVAILWGKLTEENLHWRHCQHTCLPDFQNIAFSVQLIYGLKENFRKVDLSDWKYYMPQAIGLWDIWNTVTYAFQHIALNLLPQQLSYVSTKWFYVISRLPVIFHECHWQFSSQDSDIAIAGDSSVLGWHC